MTDAAGSTPPQQEGSARKSAPAGPPRRDKSRDLQLVGKVIADKYKVLDVLGQGGFGTVYRVEIIAGMVGEKLALKILPEELGAQPAFREQFLNEIRVAMRLVDRHIVQIRDVGVTQDGILYYTMDLCPGTTLAQILRQEGKLPITRALLIILNVLRGLQTAHAAGIVHRDLKPGNIMVDVQTGKDIVRVLDFGIATVIQSRDRLKGAAGSPHYMPPEQFLGEPVGFYSDLYSVGVLLYECITGQKPHPGTTPQEVFKSLKGGRPAAPESLVPEVSSFPGLSDVITRALERNPERRFQSALELFEALNAILQSGTGIAGRAAPAASRAAAPAARATQERRPAPQPAPVRISAEHVRRHRRPRRSPGSNAAAVALATLLIAGVVSAVVFHKELARWLESSPFGPAKVAPSGDDAARKPAPPAKTEPAGAAPRPRVGAPEEKAVPRVADETPAPPATIDSIEEKKAAARKVLEQRLAELLDEAGQASERGDWKQVAARCDTAVALDPGNTAALQLLGVASLQQGDAQKALESFRAARERLEASEASVPPALEARIAEALLGLDPPQAGEAGAIAARLLAVTPRDVELHVLRIRALQAQGKTDELRAALGAAQELKLESPELTAAAAKLQAAAAQDRAAQAAVALTEATGALAKGDWRQAAQHATRALELQRSASSAAVLAVAQLAAGEIAAARKTLDAAGEPGGEDAAGKLRLEELRALAGGMEALQRAAGGAAPEGAAELLAAPAASKEPLVQALAQIQLARLSRLGPEDAGAPGPRKAALAAARTRLQAALKLKTFPEPLRGESSYLLGLVQLDLGDAEKSNASYQQALASFAAAEEAGLKTAELYEGWGKAYDRLGNLIRAASRFRSAYELRPTPETCLRAASSYLDANPASREAVEILREGAERFRDNAAILKKLKEIETE